MTDLEIYFENTQKPWGKMFYRLLWEQLSFAKSMDILDFGSGFGITADHLAKDNAVAAIEPNEKMCEMRFCQNSYRQLTGGLDELYRLDNTNFDLILCHNVFEYIENEEKESYFSALCSFLKKGGKLSLVKHNHLGRVMQKAVYENDPAFAERLLGGETAYAQNFGEIKYYGIPYLKAMSDKCGMKITERFGIRTFFSLYPDNAVRYDKTWAESMFALEMKAGNIEEFKNIAFYNHIILEKPL